jgi:hypothetical protein
MTRHQQPNNDSEIIVPHGWLQRVVRVIMEVKSRVHTDEDVNLELFFDR